jgi:hypothetical protein
MCYTWSDRAGNQWETRTGRAGGAVWDAQGGAGEALEGVCGGAGPTGRTGGALWNAQGRRRAAPGEMRGGASRAPTLMYKKLSCHSLVWDTYYMLMKFDYRPALELMMSNLESL